MLHDNIIAINPPITGWSAGELGKVAERVTVIAVATSSGEVQYLAQRWHDGEFKTQWIWRLFTKAKAKSFDVPKQVRAAA